MSLKQSVAEAVADIRVSLQYSAQRLREFDEDEAEQIAVRLDRLRWNLKRVAENSEK